MTQVDRLKGFRMKAFRPKTEGRISEHFSLNPFGLYPYL